MRFGSEGYDVAVNYRTSEDRAAEVVDAIESEGGSAVAIRANVGDADDASALVERASEALNGLDHVVNNAGINQHKHTDELTVAEFERMMRVNVRSAFTVSKAALPRLVDSSVEEGPSILNLASILAFTGAAHECHYSASKMAVVGLTRSHAEEFAPEVRVNALAPGHIVTDMTDWLSSDEEETKLRDIPLDRFGYPEDVAQAASFLRDASFVTGEVIHLNGGEEMR
jgi:3-oxoacyl-[acyl-carrier protein] reductase